VRQILAPQHAAVFPGKVELARLSFVDWMDWMISQAMKARDEDRRDRVAGQLL
jgi:hypothetical protein